MFEVSNAFWMRMGLPIVRYIIPFIYAAVSCQHIARFLNSQRIDHLHRLNGILEGAFLATGTVILV